MKRYRSYSPIEKALIAQLYHLRSKTRRVIHSDDPDLLHDLRGAVLRIDFAIKYLNRWLDADKGMKRMVKDLRHKMADVRALDILKLRMNKFYDRIEDEDGRKSDLEKMVRQRHDRLRSRLVKILKSTDYRDSLDGLELLIGYNKLPHTFPALKKIFKQVTQWKKSKVSPRCLHSLRLALKELRYSCEFIQNHELVDKVAGFQNILGKRQDALTDIQLLKKFHGKGLSGLKRNLQNYEREKADKEERRFYETWKHMPLKDLATLAPK